MAEIALEHITKRYGDGYEAVKDLNLEVADGEFMILVGPSGCGKSTALRMVAGLEDITDGELKIGGQIVNDKTPKDRDIAMVFQNYALYPHMTVRDNMGFALKLAGMPKAEIAQKVDEAARILDLGEHLERAAVEPRRQAAGADARRDLPDPAALRDDDAVRHPRPDRGADAG
jgi:multiple sugar transport system ATP-binding protein